MRHVVFFRFGSAEHTHEAASRLRALAGVIPSLLSIEVGVDELRTERSWDLCLNTGFADAAGLEAYQVHPAHQEALVWLKAHAVAIASVDWNHA